jgi:hypothetical protein
VQVVRHRREPVRELVDSPGTISSTFSPSRPRERILTMESTGIWTASSSSRTVTSARERSRAIFDTFPTETPAIDTRASSLRPETLSKRAEKVGALEPSHAGTRLTIRVPHSRRPTALTTNAPTATSTCVRFIGQRLPYSVLMSLVTPWARP